VAVAVTALFADIRGAPELLERLALAIWHFRRGLLRGIPASTDDDDLVVFCFE
jgi:hypothetical protein